MGTALVKASQKTTEALIGLSVSITFLNKGHSSRVQIFIPKLIVPMTDRQSDAGLCHNRVSARMRELLSTDDEYLPTRNLKSGQKLIHLNVVLLYDRVPSNASEILSPVSARFPTITYPIPPKRTAPHCYSSDVTSFHGRSVHADRKKRILQDTTVTKTDLNFIHSWRFSFLREKEKVFSQNPQKMNASRKRHDFVSRKKSAQQKVGGAGRLTKAQCRQLAGAFCKKKK
ncbi:hypothetical protein EVAR_101762_1 [Eumeta japonica]|uniref:Uncharacterized protein n=1 Tax=Eumeta variegata TaxID=151549 RepID=A0A4C1SMK5_EUMVA|nr:hypothetical protein EVAR_101762_1 [Eumeta japonica]